MPRFLRKRKRFDFHHLDIPAKANQVLYFILVMLLLIVIRVWHLSVVQYDQKLKESCRPQQKTVIVPAVRATIRDRFNLPLAVNKISYQATVLYSQLRDIPSIQWKTNEAGKKEKVFKRKCYIRNLSEFLSQELGLDADRIEDLIHSKASYYSQVPFVIKDELSESEYYRMKAIEKKWPGIHMRCLPKRNYPRGRVASDVIGYMGAINRVEYEKILYEIKDLEQFIASRENDEEAQAPKGIETTQQARRRLSNLEAKAYTIHDYIGKTGIEGVFEEQLRGYYGKKKFQSDSKGNFLYELPGSRPPISGHRILLTLSAELQEYAEELLAQNEELRLVRLSRLSGAKKTILADKEPWIKGGAIVVMEPFTGEILALASYPRYDPNDFIMSGDLERQKEKRNQINRWLENDLYLGQLWNQQFPLKRERFDLQNNIFYDEEIWLTWKAYLNFILSSGSPVYQTMLKIGNLSNAISLQLCVNELMNYFPGQSLYTIFNLLYNSEEHSSHHDTIKGIEKANLTALMNNFQAEIDSIKQRLFPLIAHLKSNYNKVLVVDLCRLCVYETSFCKDLLEVRGKESLDSYHEQSASLVSIRAFVKEKMRDIYHELDFKKWRQKEEKEFLRLKRLEEKTTKSYAKPYLDYLDQEENRQFQCFWETYQWNLILAFLTGNQILLVDHPQFTEDLTPYFEDLIRWNLELRQGAHQAVKWKNSYDTLRSAIDGLSPLIAIDYLKTMRSFEQLERPLLGHYRYIRRGKPSLEKHLAAAFYPTYGFSYGRSHGFRQAAIQGSLFKLVTAYEALIQRFKKIDKRVITSYDLNPLVMTDQGFQKNGICFVGYTEEGKEIPQLYKGGRLPRSLAHQHIGKVDLVRAIEVSSNPYFAILAGEHLQQPEDLAKAARLFSFGSRTGIDLPAEIPGKVPDDLGKNRTRLYALAIGQDSLIVTPLQTALMLAAIANGGKVLKPKIVRLTAGREPRQGEDQIICPPTFPLQSSLALVGIDFPLFSALSDSQQENLVNAIPTEIKRKVMMPEIIRSILLKGLRAATRRTHEESLTSLSRLYFRTPKAIRCFTEFKDQLLGKTSTSESVENIDLDLDSGTNIYTHVWFGSIAFENNMNDKNKTAIVFKDEFGRPELIVVVYLRYGGYGKEAAPLAAQIVKKWSEIKKKHSQK